MVKYTYIDISRTRNWLLVFSVITLVVGYFIGSYFTSPQIITYPQSYTSHATILLPAVDDNGNGVVTPLEVQVKAGTGDVLTNIDKLLFWVDTQYSIQTAKAVAESYTGLNASKFDLVYTIEGGNATIIGGPSAGAALTIATIAALENKSLKPNIMITGTIEPDGTIGAVGGVLEKAQAAKQMGATTFLVPTGESNLTYLQPKQTCSQINGFTYCETRYSEVSLNIAQQSGIKIVEVSNINQAVQYFL